jgi:hypothetical protein
VITIPSLAARDEGVGGRHEKTAKGRGVAG